MTVTIRSLPTRVGLHAPPLDSPLSFYAEANDCASSVSVVDGPQYEQRIDAKYLDASNSETAWRLESYRAAGNVSSNANAVAQQLRCYFIFKCQYPEIPAGTDLTKPVDIRLVSDKTFLEKATSNTLEIYQSVMDEALKRSVTMTHLTRT